MIWFKFRLSIFVIFFQEETGPALFLTFSSLNIRIHSFELQPHTTVKTETTTQWAVSVYSHYYIH